MKFFPVVALSFLALAGAAAAGETEFKLETPDAWQPTPGVTFNNKVMTVKGSRFLVSKQLFNVDPAKTYSLEAEIKHVSGKAVHSYVGFRPFDAQGREISAASSAAVKGSETVLLKPVKPGDKTIFVKPNALWKKLPYAVIVWNVKPDFSDLPNYNLAQAGISDIKTNAGVSEITLIRPLKIALPAGTTVRVHGDGGYMYAAGAAVPPSDRFRDYKGRVKGISSFGRHNNIWPKGTVKAQVVLLINWNSPQSVAQVKDVELEIK